MLLHSREPYEIKRKKNKTSDKSNLKIVGERDVSQKTEIQIEGGEYRQKKKINKHQISIKDSSYDIQ